MFDEPVNGLDPEGILWIRNLMTGLAGEGRTVFVSSHLMSEMENTGLGEISRRQGQHDQALGYAQQALALYREIGDPYGKPQRSTGRGNPAVRRPARAGPDLPHRRAHPPRRTGDRHQRARAHRGLAEAWHVVGQPGTAHQHRQRALKIYSELGVPEAAQTLIGSPR